MKLKNICSLLIITALTCNLVACTKLTPTELPLENKEEISVQEEVIEEESKLEESSDIAIEIPDKIDADFREAARNYFNINFLHKEAGDEKIEAFVNNFAKATKIPFELVTTKVKSGFLAGFDIDITGFGNAYQFSPMIGSIPFIGYIFEIDGNMDADAFYKTLGDNYNLSWNICTSADIMSLFATDTAIMFLMHPDSFEMNE